MNKKKAAALIGMMMYTQQEQAEQQHLISMHAPMNRINPWAFSGQKGISQIRKLVQGRRLWRHYSISPENILCGNGTSAIQRAAFLTANRIRAASLVRKQQMAVSCSRKKETE